MLPILDPPEPDRGPPVHPAVLPHFMAYRGQPSPKHASSLLRALKPVIDNGVTAFGRGQDGPVLRSHADRLALDAAASYDPSKGASLKTHVTGHLRRLQRLSAAQTQLLKVPEGVAVDRGRLDDAEREFEDREGRGPSSAELADLTGLPAKRQAYLRGYQPGIAEGQANRAPAGGDGEGDDPAVVGPGSLHARAAYLYDDLDPVDQAIVEHGFGLHGRERLPMGRIARKVNLSPGAISQRAARIQGQLDALGDTGLFG